MARERLVKAAAGRFHGPNHYRASGDVADLAPEGHTVEKLEIKYPAGSLPDLSRFCDLTDLELRGLDGTDLSPLSHAPNLQRLFIWGARAIDLSPLNGLRLTNLALLFLQDPVMTPATFRPGPALRSLCLAQDQPGLTGAPVESLVSAMDWSGVADHLIDLRLQVGGNHALAPARIDWSFLTLLPNLKRLDVPVGVWPAASTTSPLDPPFAGLPKTLERVRIDSWEPEVVERLLAARLRTTSEQVSVRARFPYPPASPRPRRPTPVHTPALRPTNRRRTVTLILLAALGLFGVTRRNARPPRACEDYASYQGTTTARARVWLRMLKLRNAAVTEASSGTDATSNA